MRKTRENITIIILALLPFVPILSFALLRAHASIVLELFPHVFELIALVLAAVAAICGTTVKQVAIVKFSEFCYLAYAIVTNVLQLGFSEMPIIFMANITTLFITGIYMIGLHHAKLIYKILGFIYILDIVAVVNLLYIEWLERDA